MIKQNKPLPKQSKSEKRQEMKEWIDATQTTHSIEEDQTISDMIHDIKQQLLERKIKQIHST